MNNHQFTKNTEMFYREGAKSAKKIQNSDFMDQGNRVAVLYADAVGSLQRKPSRPLRLSGSNFSSAFGLLFFIIFSSSVFIPAAYAMSGRDVYEKVHEVRSKALNRTTNASMILYDKGGGKRTRSLVEYSKKTDPETYKVLVMFKTPPDLKDVGFLIHARTFADRDLWAYFPEFKRVRRIPTTSQDDSFFGSDLSYDDFGGPPNLGDYRFSIDKEEVIDGRPCYVVEVTPKIRRKYTRYVAWVAKDLWIHLKIDYYQEKEIYRSGTFSDVRMIDGIPTTFRIDMMNRKTGHRTELFIENIRYNTSHPDSLFTQRALERGGR